MPGSCGSWDPGAGERCYGIGLRVDPQTLRGGVEFAACAVDDRVDVLENLTGGELYRFGTCDVSDGSNGFASSSLKVPAYFLGDEWCRNGDGMCIVHTPGFRDVRVCSFGLIFKKLVERPVECSKKPGRKI